MGLGLSLALIADVSPVLAQGGPPTQPKAQEDNPRRHPPQATPASATPVPVTGGAARKPLTGAAALKARLLATPLLPSAVHSRYSQPTIIARSTAGQCRAQCAEARGQCFSADSVDLTPCDPNWTRCVSACSGLTYARGP